MAAPSSSVPLKEYLKRYQSCSDEPKKAKKKKKKENTKSLSIGAGVLVLDSDPVWQKPVLVENAEEDNSAGEETPQIEEDVEVKRMKRLEALRSRKPYHSINEDGSGWISVSSFSGIRDISLQQNRHDENPVDVDTDLSHPRQRQRRLDTPSPERQLSGTGAEASDLSPPRRRRVQEFEAGRNLQDTDLSPMRKPGKEPTDDLSPPRRYRESLDADSHSLSRTGKGPLKDLSPPRKPRSSHTVDLSPPRKSRKRSPDDVRSYSLTDHPHRMKSRLESSENPSVMYTARHESPKGGRNGDLSALSGIQEPSLSKDARRASMFSDTEFGEGTDRRKMEVKSSITSIDPLLSRRGSEVVYRDKQGKRTSKEELMKSKEKKKEEKPLEWGKGLAQKREAEKRVKELELEKEKPFARSRDDPELEKMLKDRIRWGDPMAYLIKRNSSELILEDLGENEKMKDSGFIVPQTIPSHSWLKRGLDFPPNRYSIRPGRHWDGVDRSNGYEKELFKRQNEKRATETEAYLWSVSDM